MVQLVAPLDKQLLRGIVKTEMRQLGKIVGRSASGTYGTFKAFLVKQGLVR